MSETSEAEVLEKVAYRTYLGRKVGESDDVAYRRVALAVAAKARELDAARGSKPMTLEDVETAWGVARSNTDTAAGWLRMLLLAQAAQGRTIAGLEARLDAEKREHTETRAMHSQMCRVSMEHQKDRDVAVATITEKDARIVELERNMLDALAWRKRALVAEDDLAHSRRFTGNALTETRQRLSAAESSLTMLRKMVDTAGHCLGMGETEAAQQVLLKAASATPAEHPDTATSGPNGGGENTSEHGDHPAPAGQMFCSPGCDACDGTEQDDDDNCANLCGLGSGDDDTTPPDVAAREAPLDAEDQARVDAAWKHYSEAAVRTPARKYESTPTPEEDWREIEAFVDARSSGLPRSVINGIIARLKETPRRAADEGARKALCAVLDRLGADGAHAWRAGENVDALSAAIGDLVREETRRAAEEMRERCAATAPTIVKLVVGELAGRSGVLDGVHETVMDDIRSSLITIVTDAVRALEVTP